MNLHSQLIDSDSIGPFVEMFHIYGHGISNGVPEHVHLQRMLQETAGQMGLLIFRDNQPVALATLVPGLVEDSHFPDAGLVCVYVAGNLGLAGARYLHRCLHDLAISNGAAWYCMSSRVNTYEYRNRFYPIGERP